MRYLVDRKKYFVINRGRRYGKTALQNVESADKKEMQVGTKTIVGAVV